jgi:hypothetical protein
MTLQLWQVSQAAIGGEAVGGTYGLAQRPALSNGNLITLLNTESWRNMRSKVFVSLLISSVLGNEVQVFSADDECAMHLGGNDGTGQDTATDRDETSKWALLVYYDGKSVWNALQCACLALQASKEIAIPPNFPSRSTVPLDIIGASSRKIGHTDIISLNSGLWCSESQSNVLVPSSPTLPSSARLCLGLGVEEDVRLLLESALGLYGKFGGHDCGFVWLSKSQVVGEKLSLEENRRFFGRSFRSSLVKFVGHVIWIGIEVSVELKRLDHIFRKCLRLRIS